MIIKKDIFDFIFDFIEKEKKKDNLKCFILTGKQQITRDGGLGYDYRLDLEKYIDSSITIVFFLRKDNSILAKTTYFFTDYKVYKDVFFWQRTNEKYKLSKKFLRDYKDLIGDTCLTLGYSQIASNIRNSLIKSKIVALYLKLIKSLINHYNLFLYQESAGLYHIDLSLLSSDFLDIDNDMIKNLGKVRPISIATLKLPKLLGLSLMEGLYHDSTLGPIFFSRNVF